MGVKVLEYISITEFGLRVLLNDKIFNIASEEHANLCLHISWQKFAIFWSQYKTRLN